MYQYTFPTDLPSIQKRLASIKPTQYGRTRNFLDGDVTYLSPYISRGVLSTRKVLDSVVQRGIDPSRMQKFIQELAWRDYWQQVWKTKGDAIDEDLKRQQPEVKNHEMPEALVDANSGIEAIDLAIRSLYTTGYMHNHIRMYVAAVACNIGGSHWKVPAKWMYYHLLDGDWASNALSWQWVAGSNAGKKYVANQSNINKYCKTEQKNTFLDTSYPELFSMDIPNVLRPLTTPDLTFHLPQGQEIEIDESKPTYVYNWYNLDPHWGAEVDANRVLLLEPHIFDRYPISDKSIEFMISLAQNIPNLQICVGSFSSLQRKTGSGTIHFKEHPLNTHYAGTQHSRDWLFPVEGYYPSFFAFYKKCKKQGYEFGEKTIKIG